MQGFLEYVAKGLVQNPEAVTVTPVEREGTTVYELRLDPQDVGKIIGRQGMTINAIRSLLLAGSAKQGLRCALEIVEEQAAGRGRHWRARECWSSGLRGGRSGAGSRLRPGLQRELQPAMQIGVLRLLPG